VTLARGRVLKAELASGATAVTLSVSAGGAAQRARVVRRELLEAEERGRALVAEAERKASEFVEQARRESAEVRLRAEAEGRAEGMAALATRAIAFNALESQADERALDRVVELARLLSERLLGEALRLEPERVIALARQALKEARGARRITIYAHPQDIPLLEPALASMTGEARVALMESPESQRGDLRIQTEFGVLDATLGPELDRLALKLREALGG